MSDAARVLEQLGAVPVARARAPFLHNKVERLAARAGVQKPLVYVIADEAPNACAVGLSDDDTAVAVTTGLLAHLDENEIEAVLAHELGHIQKGHSIAKTKVALQAVSIAAVAGVAGNAVALSDYDVTPDDGDSNDLPSTLIRLFGSALVKAGGEALAGSLLTAASFGSEFEADECGGRYSRKPWALASALTKIEVLSQVGSRQLEPAVSQLFIVSPAYLHHQTHPSTSERIARLSGMKLVLRGVGSVPTVFCSSCGDKTDADGVFCHWCGCRLDSAPG